MCHNSPHVAPWLVAPPCWWAFHLPHLHAAPKKFHVTICEGHHSLQQPYFKNVTFSIPIKGLTRSRDRSYNIALAPKIQKYDSTSPPVAVSMIININLLQMKTGYHVGKHVEMAPTHCHIHIWIQKVDVGIHFSQTNWAHFSPPPQTLNKHHENETSQ